MRKKRNPHREVAVAGSRRLALLVLGMHRSGTSALTGVFGMCGAALPKHPIPPNARNPLGYFESRIVYKLHDELLAEAGTSWRDLAPLPESWLSSPAAEPWTRRMLQVIRDEFGDSRFFVLKDPRLCRLVPFWLRVLERLEADVRFVIPIRDPLATSRSLRESEGLDEGTGLLLWLDYFLSAEHDSRGHPRSFVSYEDLLADWHGVVGKVERDLGFRFPARSRSTEAEVDAFLSPRLRHQASQPEDLLQRTDVHRWVKDAWRWARATVAGRPATARQLDRIRRELRSAESAFGPALARAERARAQEVAAQERAAREHESELARLRAELSEHRERCVELRAQLGERRAEAARLGESVRMLLRWVVDRERGADQPAPASLKAALDALEKAQPVEIPGIASTGLLLAEQRHQIAGLEAEREARAGALAELAGRLDRVREELAERDRRFTELARSLEQHAVELGAAREELSRARGEARELRARVARETSEADRLARVCAELLGRSGRDEEALGDVRPGEKPGGGAPGRPPR